MLLDLDVDLQLLIDVEDGLADFLQVEGLELVDKTNQKHTASYFVILAVDVDSMAVAETQEEMNRVDCDYKFVEGQVGIVFIAEVVNFSILAFFQYLLFESC